MKPIIKVPIAKAKMVGNIENKGMITQLRNRPYNEVILESITILYSQVLNKLTGRLKNVFTSFRNSCL